MFTKFQTLNGLLLSALLVFTSTTLAAVFPAVSVVTLAQQNVTQPGRYLGRIEPLRAVDVASRTEGVVAKRYFRDGETVEAGQPLFEIEPAEHKALLARAEAQVSHASAQARDARQHLRRLQRLGVGSAVSQSELDSATATRDMADAALKEAEAQLQTQRLNLGFTRIVAPISGRAGHSDVHEGTLVNPARGTLVTLNQIDPVRVVIAVNERDYLTASQHGLAGDMEKANQALTPILQLANNEEYPQRGEFVSVDNHIDPHTGTVAVSLQFANPQHLLLPGGVANVQLIPKAKSELMLPLVALQQDAQGYYVLKVVDDRVESVRITIGGQIDRHYVVTSGLHQGDRVIVAGIQRVRPGIQVFATEAP
ncbi:efflux RND transporter periplasmic adaptor subunit [Erwinia psidii]|uniref:Efflux RND transporter periplasmic adaptor subunit n=1 Tax=Erwinia psidii TaxID=69224 RepID=A0A3N6S0E6_9GAMM|nr:efflux RND transporter periplasmic adaptor subunit [Erwinia psidii]MCX8958700.1 efflux RND transporter periplasmic adaptor subunit [Erwinia psidii]MCX8961171.1 efflux RND transporter periplasmic adaptor subunit [Erwinia psidii]MCX8966657.1 efflux RND transporter periplasmic adaptor subunit [Erwinia psidii]RQM38964.1 efflux RND transporter periplasmic adaptor subunit [Erwinia psidii]